MQGPWAPISKLFARGAARNSGQGWAEEARVQGYPWEGCPTLLRGRLQSNCSSAGLHASNPRKNMHPSNGLLHPELPCFQSRRKSACR
eukprot:2914370-Pyramimonas_sp.AAC.1